MTSGEILELAKKISIQLEKADYAGYDPYDGLESRLFRCLPGYGLRLPQLVWIQLIKRLPINLRRALQVPSGRNSKAIALCASALLRLSRLWPPCADQATELLEWLQHNSSQTPRGLAWGYSFAWRSRSFFVARDTPNAICTIFAGEAFLDAYFSMGKAVDLETARSAGLFLQSQIVEAGVRQAFIRYVPSSETRVHNVILLGAGFLARLGAVLDESGLCELARQLVGYSASRQRSDSSWAYGEDSHHGWIDNFHTGYNLVGLRRYALHSGDHSFDLALERGYEYWDRTFGRSDGAPPYYADRDYPYDVHSAAQGIITYLELEDLDRDAFAKAGRMAEWAFRNLLSPHGYFYYQKHRFYTNRIPYTRWSQAWMLAALTRLLERSSANLALAPRAKVK